jgi:hypothetical protein
VSQDTARLSKTTHRLSGLQGGLVDPLLDVETSVPVSGLCMEKVDRRVCVTETGKLLLYQRKRGNHPTHNPLE